MNDGGCWMVGFGIGLCMEIAAFTDLNKYRGAEMEKSDNVF